MIIFKNRPLLGPCLKNHKHFFRGEVSAGLQPYIFLKGGPWRTTWAHRWDRERGSVLFTLSSFSSSFFFLSFFFPLPLPKESQVVRRLLKVASGLGFQGAGWSKSLFLGCPASSSSFCGNNTSLHLAWDPLGLYLLEMEHSCRQEEGLPTEVCPQHRAMTSPTREGDIRGWPKWVKKKMNSQPPFPH